MHAMLHVHYSFNTLHAGLTLDAASSKVCSSSSCSSDLQRHHSPPPTRPCTHMWEAPLSTWAPLCHSSSPSAVLSGVWLTQEALSTFIHRATCITWASWWPPWTRSCLQCWITVTVTVTVTVPVAVTWVRTLPELNCREQTPFSMGLGTSGESLVGEVMHIKGW